MRSSNINRSTLLFIIWQGMCQRSTESLNCSPDIYYSNLLAQTGEWSRDDVEALVIMTHTSVTPFYGSAPGVGDVLGALMNLDQGSASETIHLFYLDYDVPDKPLDRTVWVPEHIIPVLWTSDSNYPQVRLSGAEFDAAFSDLHNLRPCHPDLDESSRGTEFFGLCPSNYCTLPATISFNVADEVCICGETFQPSPSARGPIARALLYMQLRYMGVSLSDCHLEQLVQWHVQYPPTPAEVNRNFHVCEYWQGNRNPFIDYPALATSLRVRNTECDTSSPLNDEDLTNEIIPSEGQSSSSSSTASSPPTVVAPSTTTTNTTTATTTTNSTNTSVQFQPSGQIITDVDVEQQVQNIFTNDQAEGNTPTSDSPSSSSNLAVDITLDGSAAMTSAKTNDNNNNNNGIHRCSDLLPGDIYFYMVQALPTTRIKFYPLIDLPIGLDLYLINSLSNNIINHPWDARTITMNENNGDSSLLPQLMQLHLENGAQAGISFGYGNTIPLGDSWNILTNPVIAKGSSGGGDELFVFCVDENEQVAHVLSSFSTKQDSDDDGQNYMSSSAMYTESYGVIELSKPMDYYVYNGPYYYRNDDFQKAFINPSNWLGLEDPPPEITVTTSTMPPLKQSQLQPEDMSSLRTAAGSSTTTINSLDQQQQASILSSSSPMTCAVFTTTMKTIPRLGLSFPLLSMECFPSPFVSVTLLLLGLFDHP